MKETASVRAFLQPCAGESACLPSRSRVQRVSTLRGMQEVPVVEECGCSYKQERCYRHPHTLQLHPGTPYETHLDVGACSGRCDSGEHTDPPRDPVCRPWNLTRMLHCTASTSVRLSWRECSLFELATRRPVHMSERMCAFFPFVIAFYLRYRQMR